MEPLVSIRIHDSYRPFRPGEDLHWEYQLDAVEASEVQAIEASVLWHTEGKGDEDLAVHHFERLLPSDVEAGDLRAAKVEYEVAEHTVDLCRGCREDPLVRSRALFMRRGREVFFEQTFVLGDVPPAQLVTVAEAEQSEESGGAE